MNNQVMNVNPAFIAPLFVPGDRPDRFVKAASSGADAIIIDLEDAVSTENKDAARASLDASFTDLPIMVRINGCSTIWYEKDIAALADRGFSAVMMPKAETPEIIADIHRRTGLPVVALVESARGIAEARRIAQVHGVIRLSFGSFDFCADLGCAHNREALLLARLELVMASRLAGIAAPIDGVTTNIRDEEEVADDARYAQRLGFGGKLCIHPLQIAAVLNGFRPTDTDIEWARRVLQPVSGVVAIDGNMVDEPVRARARSILRLAQGL